MDDDSSELSWNKQEIWRQIVVIHNCLNRRMRNMTARQLWEKGLCVCCGAELEWWPDSEPKAIGEGVMICGRCNENNHDDNQELMEAILLSILEGNDDAINALIYPNGSISGFLPDGTKFTRSADLCGGIVTSPRLTRRILAATLSQRMRSIFPAGESVGSVMLSGPSFPCRQDGYNGTVTA